MTTSESCAAAMWEQFVGDHGAFTAYGLASAACLLVSYLLNCIWTAWNCSYNLQLVYEYTFISVPDIVLEDLPASVTADDGVKTEPESKKPKRIDSVKGQIQCYDPSTQQYLGQVKAMSAADVHELCVKAAAAQKEWKQTSFAQRRLVLRTLQKYICANIENICRVSARDSGKPAVDACLGEVLTTCEKIRTICANGELWLQPDYRVTGPMFLHKTAAVEYVPLGIVAPIAPWNYRK